MKFHLSLQALLQSERKATEEARNACTDAEARNVELVKKLEDSELRVDQLQESVHRSVLKRNLFETKLVPLCIKILKRKLKEKGTKSSQS